MHNDQFSANGGAVFQRTVATVVLTGQYIAGWVTRQAHTSANAIKHMQHARMTGVLNSMTDAQLAQVSINRKDISVEAAKMVNLDQNA